MTVPTRDQATRDARRITLLGTAAVLWVLAWNVVGIWTRRADLPSQWPAAVLVLVESTVALVVGLLVVRRHPRNVVGWLLVAHAMAVALVMSGDESHPEAPSRPGPLSWARAPGSCCSCSSR